MNSKSVIKFICGVSLVVGPMTAMATSGVEGTSSTSTSTTPSVKDSADNASSANKTGAILSYAASAMEFGVAAVKWGECSSSNKAACFQAATYTIMGIQSLAQGNEHASKAADAAYTSSLTDAEGGSYSTTTTDTTTTSSAGSDYLKKAEAGLSSLKAQGVVDSTASTVTSPDGTTYSVADMTSASAMESAGIPKSTVDSAMDAYQKFEKAQLAKIKASTKVSDFDESGGGAIAGGDPHGEGAGLGGPNGLGANGMGGKGLLNRDPSSLAAGMSKNYNGEPIGVASDSIFLMMTRRYKVKESQDSFLGITDLNFKK